MNANGVNGSGAADRLSHYGELDAVGGDVNEQVAALVLAYAREQRDGVGQQRLAAEKHLQEHEVEQVDAIYAQADHLRAAGLFTALGAVVEGGLEVASGFATLPGSKKENNFLLQEASANGKILESAGKGAAIPFNWLSSQEKGAAQDSEGDATKAGNAANADKRALDDIKDLSNGARDIVRNALDFLRNAQQTTSATHLTSVSAIRG